MRAQEIVRVDTPPSHSISTESEPPIWTEFRVLFVDDDAANRRIGQRLLNKIGIPNQNISMAVDGET